MKRRWIFLWCLTCFCLSFLVKLDVGARISPEDEWMVNKCMNNSASCKRCLSVVGGAYSEIKSVVEACYDKYLGGGTSQGSSYNYCAMWIGPTTNSAGTDVIINVRAEDIDSGKEIGDVEIGFWGMCVPGEEGRSNLKAAEIRIENDNNSIEVPKIDGKPCVYRNPWPWGENERPALTTTTLNVRKFISGSGVTCSDAKGGAICRGEESGERVYERSITVSRKFGPR